MDQNKKPKNAETPPKNDNSQEKPVEKLWASRGVEDVYFQREAQVTWWTILGGIAVGAVLTRLESVPVAIRAGQWYVLIYLLATLLVIINSWVQTTWGSLVLRWPISIPTSLLIFFQGIAMSVAGLSINTPALWYSAISVVVITALLNQWSFSRTHAWDNLPEPLVIRAKTGIKIYGYICIFTFMMSVLLAFVSSQLLEMILSIIALLVALMALVWQHIGMTEEKRMMGIP